MPVIAYLANNHWHELILESLEALRSIIREADPELYDKYANYADSPYMYLIRTPEKFEAERVLQEDKWEELRKIASKNHPNFKFQ